MTSATVTITVIEFLGVSIASFLLLKHYQSPSVSWDVTISVYFSWVLSFATVLLLPYDLSLALTEEQAYLDHSSTSMSHMWKVVYWSTFFLAWVVLPLQLDYHSSGYFTMKEKLLDALWKQVYSLIIIVILALIFFIYMLSESTLTFSQIVAFTMALGNTYGLLLLTALLGSGLVALPKRLWESGNPTEEVKRLYLQATTIEDHFQDARYMLEDVEYEIDQLQHTLQQLQHHKNNSNNKSLDAEMLFVYTKEITQLCDLKNNFQFDYRSNTRKFNSSSSATLSGKKSAIGGNTTNSNSGFYGFSFSAFSGNSSSSTVDNDSVMIGGNKSYDKKDIVNLHAKLVTAQIKVNSATERWFQHIAYIQEYETLLHPVDNIFLTYNYQSIHKKYNSNNFVCCNFLLPYVQYMQKIYFHQKYMLYRVLAMVFLLVSSVVVWSELVLGTTLPSLPGLMMGCGYSACSYSNNSNSKEITQNAQILIQSVSFVFLCYLSLCTYLTLFRVNLGGFYRLQAPQMSSFASLLINAQYLTRLQFAIGYNFVVILHIRPVFQYCVFAQWMRHNMEDMLPIFGTSFLYFVPIFLLLFVAVSGFDGLSKLLKWCGIETEESILVYNSSNGSMFNCFSSNNNNNNSVNDKELLEKLQQGQNVVLAEVKRATSSHSLSQNTKRISNNNNVHLNTVNRDKSNTNSTGTWSNVLSFFSNTTSTSTSSTLPSNIPSVSNETDEETKTENKVTNQKVLSFLTKNKNPYSKLTDFNGINNNRNILDDESETVELGLFNANNDNHNINPMFAQNSRSKVKPPMHRDLFSLLDDDDNSHDTTKNGDSSVNTRYGRYN